MQANAGHNQTAEFIERGPHDQRPCGGAWCRQGRRWPRHFPTTHMCISSLLTAHSRALDARKSKERLPPPPPSISSSLYAPAPRHALDPDRGDNLAGRLAIDNSLLGLALVQH